MSLGRSNINSVTFSISGSDDIRREAYVTTTNKAFFNKDIPVDGGLYDRHYGTTSHKFNCATCMNTKNGCPGHDGMLQLNYPLRNPLFEKEIIKWLRVVCLNCKGMVSNKPPSQTSLEKDKLQDAVKSSRTGEKYRECANCKKVHPYIVKDPVSGAILAEYHSKGKSQKPEIVTLTNDVILDVLSSITDDIVVAIGKSIESHPKKLILSRIKIPSITIRPELKTMGGSRSSNSDLTTSLKTIFELNEQIPKEIPKEIDADLHAKLTTINLALFDLIQGGGSGSMKIVTNMNKVSNSIAARIPSKTGRIRSNLMGKKTTKMMRSVITGDKALRLDQVGVPEKIAKNLYIPETVKSWNKDRLTTYFLNGEKYPGCSVVRKLSTGTEHVAANMKDEQLQEGDVVYRNVVDGDSIGFNREPALIYSSTAVLTVKVIKSLTLRINSAICVLFNADFDGMKPSHYCQQLESF